MSKNLMNNPIKPSTDGTLGQIEDAGPQGIAVGGALLFLNILLMLFVGLYWTNPIIHQYIAGKPL